MSTQRNNPIAKAVRFALIGGAAVSAFTPAFAADEEATTEEGAERIEVTGSRIKRTDVETASPVLTLTREEITSSGYQNVEEILNNLPAVVAGQTQFISNGATGTATVDLRGLGTARTLVLVNGRRLPPGGVGTEAPDINAIPAALVERVEVLTGGGSSVYGSDAVAGVVNFILRKDFEGLEVNLGATGFQHDNSNSYLPPLMDARGFPYPTGDSGIDGQGQNISVIVGGTFEKGHATAYATWRKQDELRQNARDYSSCALDSDRAVPRCGGSATAANPNFYFYDSTGGNGTARMMLGPDNLFTTVGAANNVYNFAPPNFFLRPNERFNIGADASYEVSENFRPFIEVGYMSDKSNAQIAESGVFFETFEYTLDNPLFSAAQVAQLQGIFGYSTAADPATQSVFAVIAKRNVEGGPRQSLTDYNSSRIVIGADGDISDTWTYEASYVHSAVSSSLAYKNDFYVPNVGAATGAVGAAPWTGLPYPIFTYNGISPEAAAGLAAVGQQVSSTRLDTLNAFVTGDLPFGIPGADAPIAAVFGVEHRETDYESLSDYIFEYGLLSGQGGPSPSVKGGYKVDELFGEFQIPLLADLPMIKSLDLEIGVRSTDYSTSGRVDTYKGGLSWDVIDELKVRTAFNRAIRAPRVTELFLPEGAALWGGTDPCAGATPSATAAQCANSGVTAAQYGTIAASPAGQYNQIQGGNAELEPETSDSITFGIVAEPFDRFSFTVDYYNIEIEDVIGAVGAQLLLNTCVQAGVFCDNINRHTNGSLWNNDNGYIYNPIVNQGTATWEGVDLSVNYSMELGAGKLNLGFVGTQQLEQSILPSSALPTSEYDCVGTVNPSCGSVPEWRHTFSATYAIGDWSASLRWRYYGEVDYKNPNVAGPGAGAPLTSDRLVAASGGIEAYDWYDLVGSWQASEHVGVMVGINNILDEEPPLMGQGLSSNGNTLAGQYDTLGRYLFANVTITY